MVWAAAMVFNVEPEEIIEFLEHDCVAGVHVQELQSFALSKGYALAPFEPEPQLAGNEMPVVIEAWIEQPWLQFEGIMLGQTSKGNNHAVAWDGEQIFDPAVEPDFVGYHQFWAKIKINNHIDSKIN